MNYLIYPCKVMNITQNYSQSFSHAPHINGTPKDYPIDEACMDGGRDYMYCPCDEMRVEYIYGVGKSGTNTIWLTSTSPVIMPIGTDYVTILVTHPNDDDLSKLKVGQKFKRGDKMFREGTDGNATGNHFHIAAATGKYNGIGWVRNSVKAWVMSATGRNLKPEEAFFLDRSFTTLVKKDGGIKFKDKPIARSIDRHYKALADVLNIRSGAGLGYSVIGTYKRNAVFHADMSADGWVHTALGWVSEAYIMELPKGDINLDGKVNSEDARIANRSTVGLEKPTKEQIAVADTDGDGKITSADARTILRKSVGLEE